MTAAAPTVGRRGIHIPRPSISRMRVVQLIGLGLFLLAWQIVGSQADYLWSTPVLVLVDFVELFTEDDALLLVLATLSSLLIGLGIAIVLGVFFGLLLGRYRRFGVMFEPYLTAFYAVPRVAFVPLMVVWFGIGRGFVIASVVAACTILIVFATSSGVREAQRAYGEVATSLRITGPHFMRKVLIPGSVPFIATGVRLAVQRGIVAVIVGEFLVGVKTQGYRRDAAERSHRRRRRPDVRHGDHRHARRCAAIRRHRRRRAPVLPLAPDRLLTASVPSFYDDWLAAGDAIAERFRTTPGVARHEDRPWETTRQDARVKLLMSGELGFPTMGGTVLTAEVPADWHTGRHRHGEEAIHVESGFGYALIDGRRFDIRPGSTIHIPYRIDHQLVNLGPEPLRYVSAMTVPLERFVHLFRLEQLEDCGPNTSDHARTPAETGQALPNGRRVLIRLDEAPTDPGDEPTAQLAAYQRQHYLSRYLIVKRNGFKTPTSVAMTHVFEEPGGYHGGRHRHLEAVLYVLRGHGFSEVGDEHVPWGPGDVVHIPPAMAEHEHYNEGTEAYRLLRIQFGIRYFFQDIWPEGYTPERIHDADGRPIEAGWMAGRDPAEVASGQD